MAGKLILTLTLGTALLLYIVLEIALFKELGVQDGLMASAYFTAFGTASLSGFLYRPHSVPEPSREHKEKGRR